MLKSNQEGYRTLGWIINKSDHGLYLAVADETIQAEIAEVYRHGVVEIYDYRRCPGSYSFRDLQKWVTGMPKTQTFMVANFHLAIQDEESVKRLNFSRDMIDGLGKNIIFLVTPYWDNRLAVGAYDFYSFLKLRIVFHNYEPGCEKEKEQLLAADEWGEEDRCKAEDAKEKMKEAYALIEQVRDEKDKAHYSESEKLLLKAREIKKSLLGPGHLEVAKMDHELADVYRRQGKYRTAEELYKKSLQVIKKVLGEEHPDTVESYHNLAVVYMGQGKYKEAEDLYKRSLLITEKILGKEHPDMAVSYNGLAGVYEHLGKYREAEELYQKSLKIIKKVSGEEHPDTVLNCQKPASRKQF